MPAHANLVYAPATVRAFDAAAIATHGIPGHELMVRAATATVAAAVSRWPGAGRWLVLCGAGNNAGDGYVIARLARARGLATDVIALSPPTTLTGDAARAYAGFVAAGGTAVPFDGTLPAADLVIDALFGTGLARPVTGAYRSAIEAVNAGTTPVVAVDIPSGLDAATGAVQGVAVRAAVTVTFVARKPGLYLGAGPDCCGPILCDDLGIPAAVYAGVAPVLRRYSADDLRASLPPRRASAHKGDFGHVLIVGGAPGMAGAVRLAGEAALRSGAGLVTVATHPANAPFLAGARPELMTVMAAAATDLAPALARATVVAVGPGLGQDDWSRALLAAVRAAGRPTVVDADALNLLALAPAPWAGAILTPHPGEAGRLLGTTSAAVQADRLNSVQDLAARFGATVLLKGRGTLVAGAGQVPWVIDGGNPGMASGGMGDVLTGIVAAVLAQLRADPVAAAAAAAFAHASAGDSAAGATPRGLLAGDVIAALRPWLNPST